MTLFFYILIGIITLIAFWHACVKKEYDISRTIIINKSRSETFGFVRQLKKQPLWNPWFQRNPDTVFKFKGQDGYVDSSLYWKGRGVGEGAIKNVKVKEGKIMELKVFCIKPRKNISISYIAVKEIEPEKTKMVWGIKIKQQFPATIFSSFYNTEKKYGNDFEKGLQNIKNILESR